jgi:hypothetical protein
MENSRVAGLGALFVLLFGAAAMACGAEPEPPVPDNTTGAVSNAKAPAVPSTAQKPTGAPPTTTTTEADTTKTTDRTPVETPPGGNGTDKDQNTPTTNDCTFSQNGAVLVTRPATTRDQCTTQCLQEEENEANVTCTWAGAAIEPQATCSIMAVPGDPTNKTLTRAECLATCQQAVANQQVLEQCMWGTANLQGEAQKAQ